MSTWRDTKKMASGGLVFAFDKIERVLAELCGWKPKEIFAPVRYSSGPQEEGTSEARQVGNISDICKNHFPAVQVHWLKDLSTSGFKYNKKTGKPHILSEDAELGKFILRAQAGEVPANSLVIFDNADRASRALPDDSEQALLSLLRKDITLLVLHPRPFVMRPEDRQDSAKRAYLFAELSRAHNESATKSRYVSDSYKLRLEWAKLGNQVNMGGVAPGWVRWQTDPTNAEAGKYIMNEVRQRVVKFIVDAILANREISRILKDLNRLNMPLLGWGSQWRPSSIYHILRNTALRGELRCSLKSEKKGEPPVEYRIQNFYPRMVDDEQWELIQARSVANGKAGGGSRPGTRVNNLFPCRVICFHCGLPMVAHTANKRSIVYVCTGHLTGKACEGKPVCTHFRAVPASVIESTMFAALFSKMPSALLTQQADGRRVQRATLDNKIAALEKKRRDLTDTYFDPDAEAEPDSVKEAEYKARFKTFDDKVKQLKKERAALEPDDKSTGAVCNAFSIILSQLLGLTKVCDISDDTLLAFQKILPTLHKQLSDQALRRSIIGPLKMLVRQVDVDCQVQGSRVRTSASCELSIRYRVQLVGGAATEWIDISAMVTHLYKLHHTERTYNPEVSARRVANQRKTWAAKGGHSQESRERIRKAMQGHVWPKEVLDKRKALSTARWERTRALMKDMPPILYPEGLKGAEKRAYATREYFKRVREAEQQAAA
jgi:hypothetical protein